MQLVEFSIFDSKLELFQTPWFSINTALGKRMFTKLCNSPALDFNRFPADYTLFETGVFDQDKGLTTPYMTPKNLGLAVGYIRADWPQEIVDPGMPELRKTEAVQEFQAATFSELANRINDKKEKKS